MINSINSKYPSKNVTNDETFSEETDEEKNLNSILEKFKSFNGLKNKSF